MQELFFNFVNWTNQQELTVANAFWSILIFVVLTYVGFKIFLKQNVVWSMAAVLVWAGFGFALWSGHSKSNYKVGMCLRTKNLKVRTVWGVRNQIQEYENRIERLKKILESARMVKVSSEIAVLEKELKLKEEQLKRINQELEVNTPVDFMVIRTGEEVVAFSPQLGRFEYEFPLGSKFYRVECSEELKSVVKNYQGIEGTVGSLSLRN